MSGRVGQCKQRNSFELNDACVDCEVEVKGDEGIVKNIG
jgi:hypothetical protein